MQPLLFLFQLLHSLGLQVDVHTHRHDGQHAAAIDNLRALPPLALNKRVRHKQKLLLRWILRELGNVSAPVHRIGVNLQDARLGLALLHSRILHRNALVGAG